MKMIGAILPYADLHKKNSIETIDAEYLFTHVRGEIPPHVMPEVDLERFDKFTRSVCRRLTCSREYSTKYCISWQSPMTTSFP